MPTVSFDRHLTGITVPVSSLRSAQGCGVGEFLDLIPLSAWCRSVGLNLIQLLPINDTGFMASPYSAYSAFALHPLYLHLQSLPEAEPWNKEIEAFAETYNAKPRFDYQAVLGFKLGLLQRMYAANREAILQDTALQTWVAANGWIKAYAVFYEYKHRFDRQSWLYWPDGAQSTTQAEIEAYWEASQPAVFFYAWVQYHLETQFDQVRAALHTDGILLKGDIPILMNDDSADVWAYRDNFDLRMRAGAPPDMFATTGQHWGFPTYNWTHLESTKFDWWKARLKQAEKCFDAYRIDHVLGFFRIWSIPGSESTALLAHYLPNSFITRYELRAVGFDEVTLQHLTRPHTTQEAADHMLQDAAAHVLATYYEQADPDSPFYLLRPDFAHEPTIFALNADETLKAFLLQSHRSRILLETQDGLYAPFWYYEDVPVYQALTTEEKERLNDLLDKHTRIANAIWEDQGLRLLSMLRESTPMIPCAEDLGAVPDCVPDVLNALHIMSLKIERWIPAEEEEDGPLMHPNRYPRLCVCTPGVHDTSALRGWWQETDWNRDGYYHSLGFEGPPPDELTPEIAAAILKRNLETNALLCIFQIQDLFALEPALQTEDPRDERFNVPGIVDKQNWTYRIPLPLTDLAEMTAFNTTLKTLIVENRTRETVTTG